MEEGKDGDEMGGTLLIREVVGNSDIRVTFEPKDGVKRWRGSGIIVIRGVLS